METFPEPAASALRLTSYALFLGFRTKGPSPVFKNIEFLPKGPRIREGDRHFGGVPHYSELPISFQDFQLGQDGQHGTHFFVSSSSVEVCLFALFGLIALFGTHFFSILFCIRILSANLHDGFSARRVSACVNWNSAPRAFSEPGRLGYIGFQRTCRVIGNLLHLRLTTYYLRLISPLSRF
jgi:hypothetical protein